MASEISPKAEVSPKAQIGNNCKIFPFVYIEDDVVIGDNCIFFPFVSILNGTRMGAGNKVHQGAVIAALPQDFQFRGEKSLCVIGDNNVIRENVVINRATHTGGQTVIGNGNFLMEGSHVSHDTVIGDNCTIYQNVTLGGTGKDTGKRHPTLGNNVLVGSGAKVLGPFTVGDNARIAAGAVVLREVPPNATAVGVPARIVRLNGIRSETLDQIHVSDPVEQDLGELEHQLRILSGEMEKLKAESARRTYPSESSLDSASL